MLTKKDAIKLDTHLIVLLLATTVRNSLNTTPVEKDSSLHLLITSSECYTIGIRHVINITSKHGKLDRCDIIPKGPKSLFIQVQIVLLNKG